MYWYETEVASLIAKLRSEPNLDTMDLVYGLKNMIGTIDRIKSYIRYTINEGDNGFRFNRIEKSDTMHFKISDIQCTIDGVTDIADIDIDYNFIVIKFKNKQGLNSMIAKLDWGLISDDTKEVIKTVCNILKDEIESFIEYANTKLKRRGGNET